METRGSEMRSLGTSTARAANGSGEKEHWLSRAAVEALTRRVEAETGARTRARGYDGLVDVAKSLNHRHEDVTRLLRKAVPSPLCTTARILAPDSKPTRRFYAWCAAKGFSWLVGECEPVEVQEQGINYSAVKMKKCKFLSESGCAAMCCSVCKMPTQEFLAEDLGVPTTMRPNFEDMSCEMIFGLQPLPVEEDPAMCVPCLAECKLTGDDKRFAQQDICSPGGKHSNNSRTIATNHSG